MKRVSFDDMCTALDAVRGRARTRTVDRGDLVQALSEAQRTLWGWVAGDTVANAYRYPAHRMRLCVLRAQDGYRVAIDWGNAHKGSSPLPARLPRQHRLSDDLYLAVLAQAPESAWDYLLDWRQVAPILRRLRVRARATIHWSEVALSYTGPITTEDSLAAGNCPQETSRIARAFGSSSAPWPDVRAWIEKHEPQLWLYAQRAVKRAAALQV